MESTFTINVAEGIWSFEVSKNRIVLKLVLAHRTQARS
jgi:hypothetical protein